MSEPYADEQYYKNDYEGDSVETADFPKFAKRSSRLIDVLTEYQIQKIGLDKFSDDVKRMIQDACCAQIEFYQTEGIQADISGESGSASIGGFSYSGTQSVSKQASRVSPTCLTFLEGTGLLRKRSVRIGVI